IESPSIATAARAGHFVIIRFSEELPRIPFTIVDTDPSAGTFTIIIHKGARLTALIDSLEPGREVPNLLGPLGQAFDVRNYGTVLCIGDGEGFVPLLPVIHALKEAGNKVIAVLSEFTEQTSCLRGNAERWADEILHSADKDEAVKVIETVASSQKVDLVVITGPTDMMHTISETTRRMAIHTLCILNMIMLDGVGLCGICRVLVGGQRKLTCIDGPTFDAHEVDFTQLLNRQRNYV
ncbi:MAG: sulfide/dihydroorotate dehydrogenase-like FAD/NAD-binding protein, partial [Duncaniella sp.]|nr:sulfide/dihydroorotate dehydrogenase-like FAD/NAD-binding protein [Duncaniella sp.]